MSDNKTDDKITDNDLPKDKIPVIRVPARVADQNAGGSIFGGWIMSYVDVAGSIPALEKVGGAIVTRAVNSFEFKQPVFVGDLVSYYAEIVKQGRSSLTVKVEVYAQRMLQGKIKCYKVTEAVLVYVAIDENRRPKKINA